MATAGIDYTRDPTPPCSTPMKIPRSLQPLVDAGLIDEVVQQLPSGKEATVYVVACGDEIRCAKAYRAAENRSFKQASGYREGRKARGSRDARAAGRGSRHGRKVQEEEWQSFEVDALYRLTGVGVRVPQPHGMHEGVLLMDLVLDEDGDPAPQLGHVAMSPVQAREWHGFMIRQIVRMLCAGLIHGDLSEYNVLLGPDGPVIIDLPQAVNASNNNSAFDLLARDVNNMRATFSRAAPELAETQYAREIWKLYEEGELLPETPLTGIHVLDETEADLDAVLDEIDDARREFEARELARSMGV